MLDSRGSIVVVVGWAPAAVVVLVDVVAETIAARFSTARKGCLRLRVHEQASITGRSDVVRSRGAVTGHGDVRMLPVPHPGPMIQPITTSLLPMMSSQTISIVFIINAIVVVVIFIVRR